jgi:hypothetical protein
VGLSGKIRPQGTVGFVPEGLNGRSQAIYCLECRKQCRPSRRDGLILTPGLINRPDRSTPTGPNQTVPYGTDSQLDLFQAMNCLATIISPYGTDFDRTSDSGRSCIVACGKENEKDLTAILLRLILSRINEKLPFSSP